MTQEAVEKIKVTLIQGRDGQIRRVRVGDQEVVTMHAGPTIAEGQMAVTLTILNVDVAVEKAEEPLA